jgi:hypothetical protein
MQNGATVPDCLAKTMLDAREEEDLDHIDMSILASAFMIGGVETVRPNLLILGVLTEVECFTDCGYHAMVFCANPGTP